MHRAIVVKREYRRGCGWRKPGGLYLVADGPAAPCGKLPIPLEICPTCGGGIKPSRGWTWVNGTALAATKTCESPQCSSLCPLAGPLGRAGLLWIGEKFYPRPIDWEREADAQGVSRRIPAVPRDFKLGETWVLVAHRKAIEDPDGSFTPAIFRAFKPTRIEVVVTGDEPDDEIDGMVKRGLTPIKIERAGEQTNLALDQGVDDAVSRQKGGE